MILTSFDQINVEKLKVIAFDLDGTLTQHRTPLDERNRAVLDKLSQKYRILMVGAGMCMRIFNQMGGYPVDILGNYGLQYGKYNKETGTIDIIRDTVVPCDRERAEKKKAINEIKDEISGMAVDIASKVVEREISAKDHEKLIEATTVSEVIDVLQAVKAGFQVEDARTEIAMTKAEVLDTASNICAGTRSFF